MVWVQQVIPETFDAPHNMMMDTSRHKDKFDDVLICRTLIVMNARVETKIGWLRLSASR